MRLTATFTGRRFASATTSSTRCSGDPSRTKIALSSMSMRQK
jgi:hypothetical protein